MICSNTFIQGRLFTESLEQVNLVSEALALYVVENTRQPMAPWLPIIQSCPSQGIALAIAAIRANIPFMFIEPTETPSHYDRAIADAYKRHQDSLHPIGLFSRSSGSSGRVKIIPRTVESWLLSFEAHRIAFDLGASHNWLIPGNTGFSATVYHALLGLYLGKSVVVQGSLSPHTSLKIIQSMAIDTLFTVPTRLGLILKAAARQACEGQATHPITLKQVITVGEVLLPKINTLAQDMLGTTQLFHYYGAAELGQVAHCTYKDLYEMPTLLGTPFEGVTLHIDQDNNIYVSSPYLALDYPAPATVYDKGCLEGDRLFFRGRVDLQFNKHGKKYNLEPLRDFLSHHNKVSNFWIERVPDPHQGLSLEAYTLHLLLEVHQGDNYCERFERPLSPVEVDLTLKEIKDYCKMFFSPKAIYIYSHAAFTSGGKIAWHLMTPKPL